MWRKKDGVLEVLLAHPGGPHWKDKDLKAWSIPKGEIEPGEDPFQAAMREFEEELGIKPVGVFAPLHSVRTSEKTIEAWALCGDCDPSTIVRNRITIKWPPGQTMEIPEVDRAEFFDIETAKRKIHKGQLPLLFELHTMVCGNRAERRASLQ